MKKIFKAMLAVLVVAAASGVAYRAYGAYVAANMSEDDLLLTENVLALSDDPYSKYEWDGKWENKDVMVCASCNLQAGKGICCFGLTCEYTCPTAGHYYNCKGGKRQTFSECHEYMTKWRVAHPKGDQCKAHM